MITVVHSEVRALIADLTRAEATVLPRVTGVVTRGVINVKGDWRARWSGMRHAPALPAAITDDVTVTAGTVRGEVGPDKERRQGPLGNLIEFGSVNNAPRPGGLPALAAEEPRFAAALVAIADPLTGP